jgi:hypothetical protein
MREGRPLSWYGLMVGALIGLGSALLVGYLTLFFMEYLGLPWPGSNLAGLPVESWFTPLLALGALLGAAYYRAEA